MSDESASHSMDIDPSHQPPATPNECPPMQDAAEAARDFLADAALEPEENTLLEAEVVVKIKRRNSRQRRSEKRRRMQAESLALPPAMPPAKDKGASNEHQTHHPKRPTEKEKTRSRELREWTKENGHPVADSSPPPAPVQDASNGKEVEARCAFLLAAANLASSHPPVPSLSQPLQNNATQEAAAQEDTAPQALKRRSRGQRRRAALRLQRANNEQPAPPDSPLQPASPLTNPFASHHFSQKFQDAFSRCNGQPIKPRPLLNPYTHGSTCLANHRIPPDWLPPHPTITLCIRGLNSDHCKQGIFDILLCLAGYRADSFKVTLEFIPVTRSDDKGVYAPSSIWAHVRPPPDDLTLCLLPKRSYLPIRGHLTHSVVYHKVHNSTTTVQDTAHDSAMVSQAAMAADADIYADGYMTADVSEKAEGGAEKCAEGRADEARPERLSRRRFGRGFECSLDALSGPPLEMKRKQPSLKLLRGPRTIQLCIRGLERQHRKQGVFRAVLDAIGYDGSSMKVHHEFMIKGELSAVWAVLVAPYSDPTLSLVPTKANFSLEGYQPRALQIRKTLKESKKKEKAAKVARKLKAAHEAAEKLLSRLLRKGEVARSLEEDEAAPELPMEDGSRRIEGLSSKRKMTLPGEYHQSHKAKKTFGTIMHDYDVYYRAIDDEGSKEMRDGPESLAWISASFPVKLVNDVLRKRSREKWSNTAVTAPE